MHRYLIFCRYDGIIKRLNTQLKPDQWKHAKKLLGWLACAKRPLKWREIQAATSFVPRHQEFDFEEKRLLVDVKKDCSSLVNIDGDRVELVHTTARRYATFLVNDD
jgi:hypothetical protein